MKKINKPRCYSLILTAAVLLTVSSGCSQDTTQAQAYMPPPPAVTVAAPVKMGVTDFEEFSGTTEAVASVTIRARIEGVLEKVYFKEGAMVDKGDLLFTIDPRPFKAGLDKALADLAMRRAELELAKAKSLRREAAFKDKAVSEVEVIESRANLASAKAAVSAAAATVKTAELDLSYTRIKAPMNGRISRSLVDTGNLVGAGERTLLATIIKDDPIYVYFTVNERNLLSYGNKDGLQPSPAKKDTPVFLGLSSQDGFPHEGRIDYIHNKMDADTGTISIRAVFPNPDHRLMPGLFARVKVPVSNAADALLVPETAMGRDQQGYFLLAVNPENRVEYKPVVPGALVDDLRVIAQGLLPADRIITNGIQKARPGSPVTPQDKTATASSRNKPPESSI
ncbi:MAG: efflux RND transporter periplasmic adaptor subunit [Desulfobacterales bacterium]|nr:efflux RND transporter periplasmic adaptor subunit [Desulfobacterales bacterium]